MNEKTTKRHGKLRAAAAGLTGIAMLLGGFGSFALWSDQASLPNVTIQVGTLDLSGGDPNWEDRSADVTDRTWDPAQDRMVPGDVVALSQVLTVAASGKNLRGELSLVGVNVEAYEGYLTAQFNADHPALTRKDNDPLSADYNTFVFNSALGTNVTIPVEVVFTFNAHTPAKIAQNASVDLSGAEFVLTQIRGGDPALAKSNVFEWGGTLYGMQSVSTVSTTPVVRLGGHEFTQVSAGHHSCAVTSDNDAYCWGPNGAGQLGDGSTTASTSAVKVLGARKFSQVSAGMGNFSCGITDSNDAYCWGVNSYGQLGDGTYDDSTVPVAVAGGHKFTQISAGGFHACAVTTDNDAYCWGYGGQGNIGDGGYTDRLVPALVTPNFEDQTFSKIAAGNDHTCATSPVGETFCWGRGDSVGANGVYTAIPLQILGDHQVIDISAGQGYSCAVTTGNDAYCWGSAPGGLGTQWTPTLVPGGYQFASISTRGQVVCALRPAGDAFCWGEGSSGQLGDGTESGTPEPVPVAGGRTFSSLAAGFNHVLAVQG